MHEIDTIWTPGLSIRKQQKRVKFYTRGGIILITGLVKHIVALKLYKMPLHTIAYRPAFYEKVKPLILIRDDYKCVICGKRSKMVHHIDGDAYNHRFENLVVVCKNRHLHKRASKETFLEIAESCKRKMQRILRCNPWR